MSGRRGRQGLYPRHLQARLTPSSALQLFPPPREPFHPGSCIVRHRVGMAFCVFLSSPFRHPPPSSVCFRPLRLFPQEARMARAAERSWLASKSPPFSPEFTMMQFRWSLMKISPSAPPLPLPLLSVPPKIPFGAKPVSASPRGGSELRHRSPGLLDFRSSLSPPKVITFAPQSHHFPPQT